MFRFLGLCFGTLVRLLRARRSLLIENLALRQQLAVLKGRHPRPRLDLLDKLFWVAIRRCSFVSAGSSALNAEAASSPTRACPCAGVDSGSGLGLVSRAGTLQADDSPFICGGNDDAAPLLPLLGNTHFPPSCDLFGAAHEPRRKVSLRREKRPKDFRFQRRRERSRGHNQNRPVTSPSACKPRRSVSCW